MPLLAMTGEMPAPPASQAGTVLVLDDSRAQRELLASLLRNWGHQVITCASGAKALELARNPEIGLIISDWMMPGMTGPEFCRALRRSQRDIYAYVILLTSKSEVHALSEGLEAGADDFLNKPVRPPELRARLNAGARIVEMQRELVQKNTLLSAALDEIRTLYSALDEDLDEARRLQQSLLKNRFRRFGSVDISLWLQPSAHVSGDMVGCFPVSEQIVGVFSLDVSGHGVASAMIAARIAGMLSDASPDQNISLTRRDDGSLAPLPPDMAAWRLNAMILKEFRTDRYFTMCLGFLNHTTGLMRLVQAGHPAPLLLRGNGQTEWIGKGGLPIGLVSEASYSICEARLEPGDRLLMFSDGLTECPDPGGAILDEAGLERLVRHSAGRHRGKAFLGALASGLSAFAGTNVFPDDASALWLEFNGGVDP